MRPELLVCGNIARDVIFGHEKFGGSAAIIAVNTQRLGIFSGLLSVIGNDSFSNKYWRYLKENGIELNLVSRCLSELPECIVSFRDNNRTSVDWIDHDCHKIMEAIEIDPQLVLKYQIVHLVSCPPRLARRLAKAGCLLSYEPGPYLHTSPDYLDPVVIEKSRLIFFNEEELQSALAISGFKSPKEFIVGSSRVLVVTRGEKGSDIYLQREGECQIRHIDTISVPKGKIVDFTGAGDCYKAGFLSGYIWGKSFQECAELGSRMGAACIIQKGGILPKNEIAKIKSLYL